MRSLDGNLLAALQALVTALDEVPAPSMIIGGIAAIAHGVARSTLDIDAAVWAEHVDVDDLVKRLSKHEIEPRIPDAIRFARQNQVLLLAHAPSRVRLDLGLAWLPFEGHALARAARTDFGGVSMTVVQPEDLIVYKTVAWRDRDRDDIQQLLRRHQRVVDLDAIRARVREFALALDEPERVDEFERLVHETLKSFDKDK